MGSAAFDAFISYSHAEDRSVAKALQHAVERYAKKWHQRRALRMFRDESTLQATATLWSTISQELDRSRYLILLASKSGARSEYVAREVLHWIGTKGPESILIVLTDGRIEWDSSTGAFDLAVTDAIPEELAQAFPEEPLYVDVRTAENSSSLDVDHAAFGDAVVQIAATLHGRSKDEIAGEDLRQHRRTTRLASTVAAVLGVLLLATIALGVLAESRRRVSVRRQMVAESRAFAAHSQLELEQDHQRSLIFAIEAGRRSPTTQAWHALSDALESCLVRLEIHTESRIQAVRFGPDDETFVVVHEDGTIRVFEAAAGAELTAHEQLDGDKVLNVVQSPDRRWIAINYRFSDEPSPLKIVELPSLDERMSILATAKAFDVSSARLFSTTLDTLRVDDLASGEPVWEISTRGSVSDAAFSPDGSVLVVASFDNSVTAYDAETGRKTVSLQGHEGNIRQVSFDPDGSRIATACTDGKARLFKVSTGELLEVVLEEDDVVSSATFNDLGHLAVADWNGQLHVSVDRSPLEPTLLSLPEGIGGEEWSSDGRRIGVIAQGGGMVHVLDSEAPSEHHRPVGPYDVAGFCLASDRREVLTFTNDTVRIFDLARTQARHLLQPTQQGNPRFLPSGALAFHPEGRLVALGKAGGSVAIFDVHNGRRVAALSGTRQNVTQIRWNSGGDLMAIEGRSPPVDGAGRLVDPDPAVHVFDIESEEMLHTFEGSFNFFFVSEGPSLVLQSVENTQVVNPRTGLEVEPWWDDSTGLGRPFVRMSPSDEVLLGQVGSANEPRRISLQDVEGCAFSRSGDRFLAWCSDGSAVLFDCSTGRRLLSRDDHRESMSCAEFSPDGSLVLTAGPDRAVLFNAWTGDDLWRIVQPGRVTCAAFSPDGGYLVMGSSGGVATGPVQGAARVYHVETGELLQVLEHPAAVRGLAFDAEGQLLVTMDGFGVGRVFEVRIEGLLELAESRLPRPLDPAARSAVVSSISASAD